jgi:hypothetical protein
MGEPVGHWDPDGRQSFPRVIVDCKYVSAVAPKGRFTVEVWSFQSCTPWHEVLRLKSWIELQMCAHRVYGDHVNMCVAWHTFFGPKQKQTLSEGQWALAFSVTVPLPHDERIFRVKLKFELWAVHGYAYDEDYFKFVNTRAVVS